MNALNLVLIFLGGGLGAVSRFSLDAGVQKVFKAEKFPLGILACNLLGCFLIGYAAAHLARSAPAWFAPLVMIGFLGGFTTFSAFGRDTLQLFSEGHSSLALANVFLSVVPGVLAVWAGLKVA